MRALETELGGGGEWGAAVRALPGQRCGALQTELGLRRILVLALWAAHQCGPAIRAAACSSQTRMSISRYIAVAVVRCPRLLDRQSARPDPAVLDDLVSGVTVAEELQDEVYRDSEPPDRGLAIRDSRIHGNAIEHERMIPDPCRLRKARLAQQAAPRGRRTWCLAGSRARGREGR